MENKNSYFRLVKKQNNVYIRIFPPGEGGKTLDIKNVVAYLSDNALNDFDLKDLNAALFQNHESDVFVGPDPGYTFGPKVKIHVSSDDMLVRCVFVPGETDEPITMDYVKDCLVHEGVICGIDEEKIQALLQAHEYCTEYLIAKGTPPTLGKDGKIEYFFQTKTSLKPKHNEDGTVDYHDLDVISHVEEGQLLARLIPAVQGQDGQTVKGEVIKAREVDNCKLSYANNITLSEDGTEIYSQVTGHASLVQGKVFVSGVYEVPADVDNSIGNITYAGNVLVKGNVKSGFVIKADGDIVVEGVVEGAQLYAGGQIIVKRGIHGMGKGVLSAKGNIIIKFIEAAVVKSGGYIETESIIQSRVSAHTEITVDGKKGFIMGGMVRACNKISAKTIGSTMGTVTVVEVGSEPEKMERFVELQKESKEISKKIEMIRPVLINYTEKLKAGIKLPYDKVEFMKKQVVALKTLQTQLAPINQEINTLRIEFISSNRAKVMVKNIIYPGVTVKISDSAVTIKEARNFCQFVKADGEIKADTM